VAAPERALRPGLTFAQLFASMPAVAAPSFGTEALLARVLNSELAGGRVAVDNGRFTLNERAFRRDVLHALEQLAGAHDAPPPWP
jgi:hypothetical protein